MKRGTQTAYVPMHADGDINHPDVEFGFITSVHESAAFCRYWYRGQPGVLRTRSNSELTALARLVKHVSVSQEKVEQLLERLE